MSVTVTLFWAAVSGASYQACYTEAAKPQVCVAAQSTTRHDFAGLKEDTDYVFSYKENGVESAPSSYHTPQKKTPAPPNLVVTQTP